LAEVAGGVELAGEAKVTEGWSSQEAYRKVDEGGPWCSYGKFTAMAVSSSTDGELTAAVVNSRWRWLHSVRILAAILIHRV
jgi:hypothetical protein